MLVIEDVYIKASGYSETELMLEIAVLLFEQEKLSLRKAATLFSRAALADFYEGTG